MPPKCRRCFSFRSVAERESPSDHKDPTSDRSHDVSDHQPDRHEEEKLKRSHVFDLPPVRFQPMVQSSDDTYRYTETEGTVLPHDVRAFHLVIHLWSVFSTFKRPACQLPNRSSNHSCYRQRSTNPPDVPFKNPAAPPRIGPATVPKRRVYACDGSTPGLAVFDGENVVGVTGWRYLHGPGVDDPLVGLFNSGNGWVKYFFLTDGRGRLLAFTDTLARNVIGESVYTHTGGNQAGAVDRATTYANSRAETPDASGLSFYRNRYYDQNTGRWTQEDPIGIAGGVNLYSYVGNNPATFSDPFGLCPKEAGGKGYTDDYADCPPGTEGYRKYLSSMGTIDQGSERVARSALTPARAGLRIVFPLSGFWDCPDMKELKKRGFSPGIVYLRLPGGKRIPTDIVFPLSDLVGSARNLDGRYEGAGVKYEAHIQLRGILDKKLWFDEWMNGEADCETGRATFVYESPDWNL